MKRKKEKGSSSYRGHKLFLSKDWFEVVRVDCGVASIPLFRINVLLFSKNVQFGTKTTRMESDNKVELRKVLGPPYLSLGQHSNLEYFFVIHNTVDGIDWTLQIVSPNFESLKIASNSLPCML